MVWISLVRGIELGSCVLRILDHVLGRDELRFCKVGLLLGMWYRHCSCSFAGDIIFLT